MQLSVINKMRARLRRIGCTDISINMISSVCCHVSFVYKGKQYYRYLNCDVWDYYPLKTYDF